MALAITLLICHLVIEPRLLTECCCCSHWKLKRCHSTIGHGQPHCSPPVVVSQFWEVSPSRSSCSQSGDKWPRSSSSSVFQKVDCKGQVFRKEICQLCCCVREPESTPPVSKMSRPLLAQPRSKFLRLARKLKRMCLARGNDPLGFEWPQSPSKDAFQLFLIVLIFWRGLWAKYLSVPLPHPHC